MRRLTGVKDLLSVDLRALALLRVALAALMAGDTLLRWVDLRAHYTDFGLLPVGPYVENFSNDLHISLHLANGTVGWGIFLFTLQLMAAFAVLVGWKTRASTLVAWVLLVSVQNRNPMLLNGGDVLLRCLFFWSLFLPMGARWSADRALSKNPAPAPAGPEGTSGGNSWFGGASIGVISQVAWVYLATVFLKDGPEWFPEGSATWYALSLEEFTTPFGNWLRQWPDFLRFASYFVFFLEWSVVFVVLCPLYSAGARGVLMVLLAGMHLNFALTMRLGIFPWVDAASLLVLMPPDALDYLHRRFIEPAPRGLKIYYDGECGFCLKAVLLLKELLLLRSVPAEPAQSDPELGALLAAENSWIVVDGKGGRHLRFDALVTLFEHAPVLGRLVRLLPFRVFGRIGDAVYSHGIAAHRAAFGKLTALLLPWRGDPVREPSHLANFAALFFTGYIALWNLHTVPRFGIDILEPWVDLGSVLRIDQKWNMFAPFPMKEGGWFVIPGKLEDGTKVNVLTGEAKEATEAKPALVADLYPNARWRKYLMNIYERKYKDYRLYYGKYICRSWNEHADGDKRLQSFEILFMQVVSPPPGGTAEPKRMTLWQHDCFKNKKEG